MKTITVRGIDDELAIKLKKTAKEQSKSINRFILDLMRQSLGLDKAKKFTRKYHDLDHLFGSWTDEEFNYVHKRLESQRVIDKELWK